MSNEIVPQVKTLLENYDPTQPETTAANLRQLWLQFEPLGTQFIKVEQRQKQETVGIPVPVLKKMGKEVARAARRQVDDYWPLAQLLWQEYGREGRVIAAIVLGAMELKAPHTILPQLLPLCRQCHSWEDADRMAMDALEPIVRKEPDKWLPAIEPWLSDANKWVRRAGVTVVGRLPMKQPPYTKRCLELIEPMLTDEETDVKKAVSFAIRLCARGQVAPVRDFLQRHVPPANPIATWVLCDAIRSMAKRLLPEFVPLLPLYQQWADDATLTSQNRRSVKSALNYLQKASNQ